MKGSWSRQARESHLPTCEGSETAEGASTFRTVSPFAGWHSKGVSAGLRRRRVTPNPSLSRIGDTGVEEVLEEGNRRLVRQSFTRVSSTHTRSSTFRGGSWSSGSGAGNSAAGLPTMNRVARRCLSGRPGKARTQVGSRPPRGRGSVARIGCARASGRAPLTGNTALPGNGQSSLQKSFGGVLVQRSVGLTAHKSPCHHRVRGPSPQPRARAIPGRVRIRDGRGDRPSSLSPRPPQGDRGWVGRWSREKTAFCWTAAAKSRDQRGAGRHLPSRKRGPEGRAGLLDEGRYPGSSRSVAFTRGRRKRSW